MVKLSELTKPFYKTGEVAKYLNISIGRAYESEVLPMVKLSELTKPFYKTGEVAKYLNISVRGLVGLTKVRCCQW